MKRHPLGLSRHQLSIMSRKCLAQYQANFSFKVGKAKHMGLNCRLYSVRELVAVLREYF